MKKLHLHPLAIALAAATLLLAQACTHSKGQERPIPSASDPIPVHIKPLEKISTHPEITVSGQLTTDDETILSFKTGGIVHTLKVKEGDRIHQGQILASLDLTEVNTGVAQARLSFEKAQRDYKRVQNLHRDSVATLEQLQNSQTALAVAQQQLEAAEFNQTHSIIRAPADGYVLRKFMNAGQLVNPGDPILTTNGAVKGHWVLKAGISDKQWAMIKIDDAATVVIDAMPNKTFQAKVVRKSGTSDPMTGAFTVELSLQQVATQLATGMFGKATIQSGDAVNTWPVPYEAVLDANGDVGYVFITNDHQTAVRQQVTIASFDQQVIHIGQGLEQAKALIVSGSAYLNDGVPIEIVRTETH